MWPFKSEPKIDPELVELRRKYVEQGAELVEAYTKHISLLEEYTALAESHAGLLKIFTRLNGEACNNLAMSENDRETAEVIVDSAREAIKLHCKHKKWVKTDRPDAMFPGDWHHQCDACGKYDYE